MFKSCNHSLEPQPPRTCSCGWGEWISGEQLSEQVLVVNKKQVSAGLRSRLIPLFLPSACLLGTAPACLPQLTLLLLLLPPSPQPQGLSEQGDASPTAHALSLHLVPALLNSQLLLFKKLVTSPLAADCFSSGSSPFHLGSQYLFFHPASSLSFPRKLVPLSPSWSL